MKTGIHPEYHTVKIIMTDGEEFETRTTWGKKGESMRLDVDIKTHPAWTGQQAKVGGNQLEKFNKRFQNFAVTGASADKTEKSKQ